ncbi:MAG: glutathione S-transferase family protein [Deltaproteobacteria bacterium]|nr:glutathione S-transferase family protein [Deltaproteobacteria bacterium]
MDEITLHQPPTRPWGSPNLSPFCAKLECYLRMAEIPYTLSRFGRGESPKGKMPYIKIGGAVLGDSQLIIEDLERRLAAEGKHPLDEGLSARDAAIGRIVRRTLEEATYFVGMYARWKTNDGYAIQRAEFKKWIPGIIIPLIRRDITKKLHHQGTGRHSFEEASAMGADDYAAIAEILGDKPFLLGDKPRTVDAALFAFVDGTLGYPLDSPLKQGVARHANLVAYRKRIRDRWWTDLPALP